MKIQKIMLAAMAAIALNACSDDVANVAPEDAYGKTAVGEGALGSEKDQTPKVPGDSVDNSGMTVYRNIRIVTGEYPWVHVWELDSATFEPTRHVYETQISTISDESLIDSLSLNSPYILIESYAYAIYGPSSYKSIVDLRQGTQAVSNVKTYLESCRLAHLMESGMPFAEAKAQAGKEVLAAFGFYDDPSHADDIDNVRKQSYKDYLSFIQDFMDYRITADSAVAKLTSCGSLDCGSDSLKAYLAGEAVNLFRYYNRREHELRSVADFLALMHGFDRCSSANEGFVFEIPNENIVLDCQKNKWNVAYKQIEYTTGTMKDARDGKTYKTVTYVMNGDSVTWMAENLNYRDSSMLKPCSDCTAYYFEDAMRLDTTVLKSVAACMEAEFADCPNCIWRDTVEIRENCSKYPFSRLDNAKYKSLVDSIMSADGSYQGVCPEGWHLPERSEWEALFDYLIAHYYPNMEDEWPGQRNNKVSPFLFDIGSGNPVGFGLSSQCERYTHCNYFVVYDLYGEGVSIDDGNVDLYEHLGQYVWEPGAIESVRCVKN